MSEIERILDQYDRGMNGKAWHGDPVWKILDGVSAEQAARRAQTETHSIWELVSHMTFWETEMCRRLSGLPARSLEGLNFAAAPEATEENWNRAVAEFRRSNEEFRTSLSKFDVTQLDRPIPGREMSGYTAYVEVQGVIQHNLYHAGQIAILRKLVAPK
jgi:uncharacterized damage-inducible protein DinB